MFTAKVKKTGEIFMATNELSPDGVWSHDATELPRFLSWSKCVSGAIQQGSMGAIHGKRARARIARPSASANP
jgi:hypothetical protein